jgi:hypothetical protein
MPPRQPLKLNKTKPVRSKLDKGLMASLADEILKAKPETEIAKPPTTPRRASGPVFSPYPDLTMAINMLAKRQQALAADGERAKLIGRWHSTLQMLQEEMQKLHKLEGLANKLARKP